MDWRIASFVVLAFWGSYMVFGGKATEVHGERVSFFVDALVMCLIAALGIIGHTSDFAKMTFRSGTLALTMGLMSGLGLYTQLYALRVAPQQMAPIAMITGSWPAITVVLACLFVGSRLQPQQWLGVSLVAGGLILVNWVRQ